MLHLLRICGSRDINRNVQSLIYKFLKFKQKIVKKLGVKIATYKGLWEHVNPLSKPKFVSFSPIFQSILKLES